MTFFLDTAASVWMNGENSACVVEQTRLLKTNYENKGRSSQPVTPLNNTLKDKVMRSSWLDLSWLGSMTHLQRRWKITQTKMRFILKTIYSDEQDPPLTSTLKDKVMNLSWLGSMTHLQWRWTITRTHMRFILVWVTFTSQSVKTSESERRETYRGRRERWDWDREQHESEDRRGEVPEDSTMISQVSQTREKCTPHSPENNLFWWGKKCTQVFTEALL